MAEVGINMYLRGPTKEKAHACATLATNSFAAETSPKAGFLVILNKNGQSLDEYLRGPTKEKSHTRATLATNTFAAEILPKAGFSSNFE